MVKSSRKRYRVDKGTVLIEIRVRDLRQLFDSRDPAPFRERDLDDDFVEYIVSSAQEHSSRTPLALKIYLEDAHAQAPDEESVREAIRSFFEYQVHLKRGQIRELFKTGQIFLAIGFTILIACLLFAPLTGFIPWVQMRRVAYEGVVISGWVAMWRPLELMLFDWWPAWRLAKLYQKIATSSVQIQVSGKAVSGL